MTATQFLGFWTPSPLVGILARYLVLNPRNLPYYVCIWATLPLLSVKCRHHLSMAPNELSCCFLFYVECVSYTLGYMSTNL